MKEFNLPDLAIIISEKHPEIPAKKMQQVLQDALEEIHKNCIEQLKNGAKVGRFEQNHGAAPFVLRLKTQEPRTGGFGPIPKRYSATIRLGRDYPRPE